MLRRSVIRKTSPFRKRLAKNRRMRPWESQAQGPNKPRAAAKSSREIRSSLKSNLTIGHRANNHNPEEHEFSTDGGRTSGRSKQTFPYRLVSQEKLAPPNHSSRSSRNLLLRALEMPDATKDARLNGVPAVVGSGTRTPPC